jgi:hypothetical protein
MRVSNPCWVFTRGQERLELHRDETVDGPFLVIEKTGAPPRTYQFKDITTLINFQCDMEALLLNTGWSFVQFSPEQRTGLERRKWPRMADRRRWWTDGVPLADIKNSKKD